VDEVEDSREKVYKRARGKRGVLSKEHKFKQNLENCRR